MRMRKFGKRLASLGLLSVCCVIIAATVSGCSGGSIALIGTDELCNDWRLISVSKKDRMTEGTASQIEAHNASREVWGCKPDDV